MCVGNISSAVQNNYCLMKIVINFMLHAYIIRLLLFNFFKLMIYQIGSS